MTPLRWLCYPTVKSSVCGKLENTLWHILLPRISLKVPMYYQQEWCKPTPTKVQLSRQALACVHLKQWFLPLPLVTETWPSSIYTLKIIPGSISPLKPTLSGAAQVYKNKNQLWNKAGAYDLNKAEYTRGTLCDFRDLLELAIWLRPKWGCLLGHSGQGGEKEEGQHLCTWASLNDGASPHRTFWAILSWAFGILVPWPGSNSGPQQ